MGKFHPDIKTLDAIRRVHCEGYVSYLSNHGRFDREVAQPGKKSYHISFTLSGKTILEIVGGVCKSFMEKLSEDAGIISNPWNNIVLPDKDETPREIFTPDELRKIGDGISEDRARMEAAYEGASIDYESWEQFAFFCRPLFLIASVTGLSESDICTLKWGRSVSPTASSAGSAIRREIKCRFPSFRRFPGIFPPCRLQAGTCSRNTLRCIKATRAGCLTG